MAEFTIYKIKVSAKGNTTIVLKSDSTVTFGNLALESVVMDNSFCWHCFRGNLEKEFTQLQSQKAVIIVDSPVITPSIEGEIGGGKLLLSANSHLKVTVNGSELILA